MDQSVNRVPARAAWALLLVSSLTVLSGAIVAPALPLIAEEFKDVAHVDVLSRLVITMPALAIALTGMGMGLVADAWGRRPLLLASLVLYAAAGTTGLYLDNLQAILIGRFALGMAVAGIMTAASTMIGDLLSGEARQQFLGRQAAFMSAGGVVFVPLGGVLTKLSYHAPFAVYGVSLAMLPLAAMALRETRGDTGPAGGPGTRAAGVPGGGGGGGVPLVLGAILLLAVLLQVAFYLGPVQTAFLLKDRFGAGGLAAGVAVGVMTLAAAVVSLNFGRLGRGRSPWLVGAATAGVMSAGCSVVAAAGSYAMVLAGLVIFGLGAGLIMPNLMSWMMRVASEAARGRATGALTAAVFAGQFLSPLCFQPAVRAAGVGHAFWAGCVGLAVLGVVLAGVAAAGRRGIGIG